MTDCTWQEIAAVVIAHDLNDGETGACGAVSPIPMAAMRLAQETHAPNFMIALQGGINPRPPYLFESPTDPNALRDAENITDLFDLFLLAERGIDVWFMAGVQTDMYGNLNLHYVGGTPEKPKFRAPGAGMVGMACTGNRWYNYAQSHTAKTFVPKVEYITALGNEGGVERRQSRGPNHGKGCALVISPLGVMDFAPDTGRMRLKSVHPGRTVDEVRAATGFELLIPAAVPVTPVPAQEEIELLRGLIDPTGVLRR